MNTLISGLISLRLGIETKVYVKLWRIQKFREGREGALQRGGSTPQKCCRFCQRLKLNASYMWQMHPNTLLKSLNL
jgi:hypothetical protein